jgi:hypothetical protein
MKQVSILIKKIKVVISKVIVLLKAGRAREAQGILEKLKEDLDK